MCVYVWARDDVLSLSTKKFNIASACTHAHLTVERKRDRREAVKEKKEKFVPFFIVLSLPKLLWPDTYMASGCCCCCDAHARAVKLLSERGSDRTLLLLLSKFHFASGGFSLNGKWGKLLKRAFYGELRIFFAVGNCL